jgi:hypothetical protein
MPLVMVVRKACAHYNEMHPDKPDVEPSAVPLNPAFVERICVNYLRHSTTRYDRNRDAVRMMADSRAAREEVGGIIKARTLAAIAVAYPTLAAEARRQAERTDQVTDERSRPRGPSRYPRSPRAKT